MRIEQIMSQPVACCRSSDNLHCAARLMWEHDCGVVPVTDDTGRLVGMITDRDICMATYFQGKPPQDIQVSQIMSTEVFACQPSDLLEAAELIMAQKQIRRLPVVDKTQRPIGMVSLNDIARHGATAQKRKDGMEHEVVQTMAAICEPRHTSIQQSVGM